jgi:hypothetical protein
MGNSTTLDELKQLITALSTNVTTLSTNVTTLATDVSTIKAGFIAVNKVQSNVVGDGSSSSARGKGVHVDTPGGPAPTASHKLRFPKYDSIADPLAWLHRCDQFFWATRTLEEEKVWYVAFYLDGDAQQWYFRLERNQGVPTWDRFVDLVSRRFGPPTRSNLLGKLFKIQCTGSVVEYQDQFLKLRPLRWRD